jgi:hypothetical protein
MRICQSLKENKITVLHSLNSQKEAGAVEGAHKAIRIKLHAIAVNRFPNVTTTWETPNEPGEIVFSLGFSS